MNRQPARFPRARQSSSSAEVWWISSTMSVSRPVMRSSWNRSEEHTSELQSRRDLHSFPTRRSSDLAGPLPEGEAELELGGGLVDLVHDERVAAGDEVVLEPPPRDAGRDDDHVPRRRLRRRLALAVDDAVTERLPEDRQRDGADPEGLPRAGPGHDAERLSGAGPFPQGGAVLPLEERVHLGAERKLDGLARGAGRRDHDDPAPRRGGAAVGGWIRGEMMVAGGVHEA